MSFQAHTVENTAIKIECHTDEFWCVSDKAYVLRMVADVMYTLVALKRNVGSVYFC